MNKRIKSIAPLQLAKILGVLYGLLGLLFLPVFLVFALAGAAGPAEHRFGIAAVGVGFAIFFPIMYAVMGFVSGLIGAFLYNLVAKWVGGIQIELEDLAVEPVAREY